MDQSVVDIAGLNQGPLEKELAGIRARRGPLMAEQQKLREQRGTIGDASEEIVKKQAAETQPAIDAYTKKAGEAPRTDLKEEKMPDFERPQFDQKELNETFGMMMVASLLLGSASRGPYNNTMNAMTGAINGFLKGDHDNVEEQFKVFDKNIAAMKERNGAIRNELQDAEKKWSHDLAALKTAYEMVAAKYDLPLAQQALKDKNLAQAQQEIWREINSLDQAETRISTTLEQGRNRLSIERIHSADRAAQREIAQQNHADAVAARTDASERAGWQVFQAPDGTLTRVNVRTGESESIDDSKGLTKLGAGGAGKGNATQNRMTRVMAVDVDNADYNLGRLIEMSKKRGDLVGGSVAFANHFGGGWGSDLKRYLETGAIPADLQGADALLMNLAFDIASGQSGGSGQLAQAKIAELEKQMPLDSMPPEVKKERWNALLHRVKAINNQLPKEMQKDLSKHEAALGVKAAADAPSPAAPYSDPDKERRYQEWKVKQGGG